jgi:hypothetical protein
MSAVTCPYCNSLVTLTAAGRMPCPRCGEEFTPPSDAVTATPPAPTALAPSPSKPVAANRLVGGIVLGVMTVMAGVGLWLALATVDTRREHDRYLPRTSRRPALPPLLVKPPSVPVAPSRLAALAYLPPGCTLVAGVHVGDLLDSPLGERLKGEPIKVGPTELSLDSVEQWLGIPAGNIDHLAVGSVLESGGVSSLTPPTVLVIRTRDTVGVNRLREALNAGPARERPTPEGGKRAVSPCRVKDVSLSLWLPNSKTVVIGLFTEFDNLPATPADDNARIVPETRQLLEERLSAGMVAWAAVSSADWKSSPLLGALPGLKALPLGERYDAVRALALGVPREKPLRVQAAVRAADEAAATKIEAAAGKDARLKVAREKEWLTVQLAP